MWHPMEPIPDQTHDSLIFFYHKISYLPIFLLEPLEQSLYKNMPENFKYYLLEKNCQWETVWAKSENKVFSKAVAPLLNHIMLMWLTTSAMFALMKGISKILPASTVHFAEGKGRKGGGEGRRGERGRNFTDIRWEGGLGEVGKAPGGITLFSHRLESDSLLKA